jgi:hypothetical protein
MDAVQTQAGEDLGAGAPQVLVIGKNAWSLGPAGPVLGAAGLGFALGTLLLIAIALFGS